MSRYDCQRDGRPITDGACVCQHCGEHLARSLGDVTALAEAVPTAYIKQIRSDARTGKTELDPNEHLPLTSKVQAIPYDEGVSVALRDLHAVLVSWVRLVGEERPVREGPTCHACLHLSCSYIRSLRPPANTASGLARWLLGHLRWIVRHDAAAEVVDEVSQAVGKLRASLDVAPDMAYAGPCTAIVAVGEECGDELYAKLGAAVVTCRTCTSEYDVTERRKWLLAAAEDVLAPLPFIEHALSGWLAIKLNQNTLRTWKHRGRIVPHGVALTGEETFRIGDVLDVLAQTPDTKRVRQAVASLAKALDM